MANHDTCECGARYRDFRATEAGRVLTFADVHAMLRVGSDDSSLWLCRSRGAVLRFWGFLKRSQWEAAHGYCAEVLAAQAVATDTTADELPEWVTEHTAPSELEPGSIELELEPVVVTAAPVAVVAVAVASSPIVVVRPAPVRRSARRASRPCRARARAIPTIPDYRVDKPNRLAYGECMAKKNHRVNFGQGQVHYAGDRKACAAYIAACKRDALDPHAASFYIETRDRETGEWFRSRERAVASQEVA